MTSPSRCYSVSPDGRVVRLRARRMPTRRVAEALVELIDAAHRRMKGGGEAVANERDKEPGDDKPGDDKPADPKE